MSRYSFICPKCKKKEDVVRRMADAEKPWRCTCCNVKMNRDFQTDIPFASGDYKRAIHSDSLAISPDQRIEHLQKFPNIKLDSQYRPIFNNFQNHQAYLNKCNIVKERKKIKPKGVRIA